MVHGSGPLLRSLHPFPLIAGLPADWYEWQWNGRRAAARPYL